MEETSKKPKHYPSDIEDSEWHFIAPYLVLITPDAPQRKHDLREVLNAVRYVVRTGIAWRYLPGNFPPWAAVYQQARRWIEAHCFEAVVDDLRALVRKAAGKTRSRAGERAGYDGYKKKRGSKVHMAVDTLGLLLAVVVTPADEQERDEVGELCRQVQEITGNNVKLAWVDQGYTGEDAKVAAQAHGIELSIVRLPEAKKGFVLLPRRWVVERSFAWKSRFRRLSRDYERLAETLVGLHFAAFASLLLARLLGTVEWGS